MSEFNVLGASDRNKRAIQLALTIPGSKTLAGGATPDLKFTENEYEAEPFIHPFKMSIIDDEGDKYLNIHEGRFTISNNTTDRTWVSFFDEYALDLSEISTSGEYFVILAIKYDPTGTGDEHDNSYFPCNVYFARGDATTNLVPGTRGFQTTVIGKIKKEVINDEVVFSVSRQDLVSDLLLEFNSLNHPFSITAYSDAFEDGSVKNSYSLSDFSFHVQEGFAIIKNTQVSVPEDDFTASQNTYVYCAVNESTLSASIVKSTSQLQYYDSQNTTYNHCLGYISFDAQNYGIMIQQFIHSTIGGGSDTYKVKTIEDDAQPDYLSGKFEFQQESRQHPLSGYEDSFIGGLCVSAEVTEQGLSGTQYKVKPIWMWQDIEGYDKNKDQFLTNNEGSLKWKASGLAVSGSLGNWEEIKEVSGKNILRWKPEFDAITQRDDFYFMASVLDSSGLGNKSVLSGLSFGKDDNKKESVMIWSNENGLPIISTPPAKNAQISSWVMTGDLTGGIHWSPYETGTMNLSGSIKNIFETVNSPTSGKILRVKTEYDDSIDQFYFLNLEADGKLSATSFFGDPLTDGERSIMTWNYESLEPQVFFCEDEDPDEDFVLAGSKESGLYWVGLYEAISSEIMELSSEFYKVKVTDRDPSANFLVNKLDSLASSLLIDVESDQHEQFVNLEINPDYFYSSDGSISIEDTGYSLDFTISSYLVQVQDGDLPEYLADKITSEAGSLSTSIGENGEGMTVNLEINPEYFFSSDGTISIEDTGDGLDFTLSSAVVSVSEGDDPDFLFDKITSENGSLSTSIVDSGEYEQVSIDINPGYFESSDGSISIEDTGDSLDFTISSFMVQVEEGDLPEYLADKISSDNGSLSTSIGSNGEGMTVNVVINPDYFISSDDSVTIEETEDGLDFTGAGKVQVTGEDEADFLENKLVVDDSIADLLALEEDDGVLYITSALSGSGLLKVENGSISFLTPPGQGNYLLACANGQFTWVEYASCEDACSGQQSGQQ